MVPHNLDNGDNMVLGLRYLLEPFPWFNVLFFLFSINNSLMYSSSIWLSLMLPDTGVTDKLFYFISLSDM